MGLFQRRLDVVFFCYFCTGIQSLMSMSKSERFRFSTRGAVIGG